MDSCKRIAGKADSLTGTAVGHDSEEINRELVELRNENWQLYEQVRIRDEQIQINATMPRLAEIRSRTLNKLKVGRQSTAGKAIDAFIREMEKASPLQAPQTDSGNAAINLLVDLACADFEKHKTERMFFDDLNRILRLCGVRLLRDGDKYRVTDDQKWDLTIIRVSNIRAVAEYLRSLSPTKEDKKNA